MRAVKDGCRHPLINKTARNQFRGGQNAHRLLLNAVGAQGDQHLIQHVPNSQCNSILLPSDVLSLIAERHSFQSKRRFGADHNRLNLFWTQFKLHPHLRGRRRLSHTIPLLVHSDGAPCTKTYAQKMIQWGSLLGVGSDREQRFVVGTWLPHVHNELPNLAWGFR